MTTIVRLDEETLHEVSRRADDIGVELELGLTRDRSIWLGQITRTSGLPGAGRRAVEMLCELADDCQVSIGLVVMSHLDPVIGIYEEAGFEEASESLYERRPEDGFVLMIRTPQ